MKDWRLEDNVKNAVNSALPNAVHKQSMTMASMTSNGTPDHYYDGSKRDLWVEYKFWERSLKRNDLIGGVGSNKRGYYSALQYAWMCRRHAVGGNVVGIIGLPDRRVVIQTEPCEWLHGCTEVDAMSAKEAAAWVLDFIGS